MRVRAAQCSVLYWDKGKLVWDGYLTEDQFALTPASVRAVRWFDDWKELESVRTLDEALHGVSLRLLEAGVLLAEDSAEHEAEERVLKAWAPWGPATRFYHFAARTRSSTYFLNAAEDSEHMRATALREPPPAATKQYPDVPRVPLVTAVDDHAWPRPSLLEALYSRRSERHFTEEPLETEELATVLQVTTAAVAVRGDPLLGEELLLTSPSAGARAPVEVYAHVRNVTGLSDGVYHFNGATVELELLDDAWPHSRVLRAVGDQPWLAAAPVLIVYTAVLERSQWRYRTDRAYRDVLLGLGHLSQCVLLTASAMGLGAVFATAARDEELERLVGCDGLREVALAVTALGRPARPVTDAHPR